MTYLDKILQVKKVEVAALRSSDLKKQFDAMQHDLPGVRDFAGALTRQESEPLRLIAELKKASPSKGVLIENFKPLELAEAYLKLGAACYSVLTDEQFFEGKIQYLTDVRAEFPLPVLRKDFLLDEIQLYESRLIGSDAILLIVAAMDKPQLCDLYQVASELGLSVLVEVHDEWELERALFAEAETIGVNNRNLKDFSVSIQTSLRVKKEIPKGIISISESGLATLADLTMIESAGFDAVLIGEGLITGEKLKSYPWKETLTTES
jgi:indole-3-glycerol phosphate synthase